MASADPTSSGVPPSGAGVGLTPAVRLEVRPPLGPPTVLDLPETGFLLGTVAGCDLRLAGAGLPPVVALLTRHADGPYLRKLMPTQPVLLNGRSVSSGRLTHGDCLSIAGVELRVHVETLGPRLESCTRRPDPVREEELTRRREALEKDQAQYQTDVVRLHRRESELEERELELRRRADKLAQDQEQLRHQSADMDTRRQRLEAEETQLREHAEQAARRQADVDNARTELTQREAGMDSQQAMLTALRARLDRLRDALRHEGQQLADQRTKLETGEADLRQQLQEAQRLRAELESESQARDEERKQFAERSAAMEEALAQFRQVQADLEVEEARLRDWARTLSAAADEQAEEASILRARATQMAVLQQRVTADRQAFRERELALVQAEQVRTSLQEQLRRRSEDLASRQRELTDQSRLQSEHIAALEQQRAEIVYARHQIAEQLGQVRSELDQRAAALDQLRAELATGTEALQRHQERLREVGRAMGRARKAFRAERAQFVTERGAEAEAGAKRQAEWGAARAEALALQEQMPELELRAQAAQERLAAAREQLREHLAEVHTYTLQGREALETLRGNVAAEAERVRQQEIDLHRAREEHRLAVAAFRQQLIEWQGQVGDLKRTLAHDETRLERREAKVEAKTRKIDAVSAQVEQRSTQVAAQERLVAERRTEVQRHLDDMREWYRHKLRELAGTAPAAPRHILPLTDEIEPGDEKLGQLLRSLDLVDAETLSQLLEEARRQRRSLRQLLLAGGYLTLYQMALMEAGNLDRLVLGPVRVIDRLRATPHETVYRVFDPRTGQEALLRHLSEDDAQDAIRPDEFRQRFAQAARVRHPNVAATLEVLELAGRPAVLQECLTGLLMTDWPPVLGGSGVCHRLLHQATAGLHAAHEAGVVHGHLHAGLVRLTGEGVLKLSGFGEPPWLRTPSAADGEEDAAADLAALGRLAATWAAAPRRKGTLLAEPLASVLERLTTENPELRFPNSAALIEELERIGPAMPDDGAAWRKLLRAVAADEEPEEELRQSA